MLGVAALVSLPVPPPAAVAPPTVAALPLTAPSLPAMAAGRDRDLDCLALAIVHEAGLEPRAGQEAVAEVVLNRLAHRAYPKTICQVVFEGAARATGCQFSFACDGALRRPVSSAQLAAARAVAAAVLDGTVPRHVPGATHYHANYVNPRWAAGLVRLAGIGLHIFYRRADSAADARAAVAPVVRATAPPFAPWGLPVGR